MILEIKEEKTIYLQARNTLPMGTYFKYEDNYYIISNRGDINLDTGCSYSLPENARVEVIFPKITYTRSCSGIPHTEN